MTVSLKNCLLEFATAKEEKDPLEEPGTFTHTTCHKLSNMDKTGKGYYTISNTATTWPRKEVSTALSLIS